jgi:hypothetical protein
VKRLARWLRDLADRIDHDGAPKLTHWTWTFELRRGAVFREDGRGCRVAYLGGEEYEKAHTQSDNPPPRVDWKALAAGDRANAVRWPDPVAPGDLFGKNQ